jgi:hypothetical protein
LDLFAAKENGEAEVDEKALIPDPRSRPWPKPIEYVLVSYGVAAVFGPLMLLFWALGDDRTSPGTVVPMVGFLASLMMLVAASTVWSARRTGASELEVTRAVRAAAPQRVRSDFLGRRG